MNKIFKVYAEKILEYNKFHKLTGFKTEQEIYDYLFLDSIKSFDDIDIKKKKILDIGTGAGIPGVALKIHNPLIDLTVLEILQKRINFLKSLDTIASFKIIKCRAEEVSTKHQEYFDIVTSRAFYPTLIALEIMSQYVKKNGLLVLIKGINVEKELDNNNDFWNELGFKLVKIKQHQIKNLITKVVIFKKFKKTPAKYPRRFSKIKKEYKIKNKS